MVEFRSEIRQVYSKNAKYYNMLTSAECDKRKAKTFMSTMSKTAWKNMFSFKIYSGFKKVEFHCENRQVYR